MALSIGIQQPPLPIYAIGSPLVLNYLDTPHATLRAGLWAASGTLSAPVLRTDESESYLRFTRSNSGIASLTIDQSELSIPAGTFDVHIWIRATAPQTDCTLGLRANTSQATADQFVGASFTAAAGGWAEHVATVTIGARTDYTLILHLGAGAVGDVIDIKLGSIMPNGQTPIFGDQIPAEGSTDFYYWEGATNGSKSIKTTRTLSNTPGPEYLIDNVTTYSITENATPLSPVDTSGGATTTQFGIQEFDGSKLLAGAEATIYEDGQPIVQGRIDTPSSDGATVSLTSMSIVSRLNVVRKVPPFVGSLDGYIAFLMAAVGVTRPLTVDLGIAERPVALHGFNDNVLARVKEFCSTQGVELSDRGDAVFLLEPRERTLPTDNVVQLGSSSDSSQLAQSVEIINYNSQYLENALIYPEASYDDTAGVMTPAGWTPGTTILTVDSGAVATYEIPIVGSLMSVEQPTCVKVVGPDDGALGSVYTVIGQGTVTDGSESIETLDPAEWEANGGSVTVRVGDNYDTIVITITSGENERLYAPYAIAMNAGSGTYYSSLRIRGTGVIDYKEKVTYPTGLGPDDTATVVGASIDTPYIQSRAQADRIAHETVPLYSMLRVSMSGSIGDPQLDPGQIAGARFQNGDAFYRVTQAISSEGGVSISATADTTIEDFDTMSLETGMTFDDFDAIWETRTFAQFGMSPLSDS